MNVPKLSPDEIHKIACELYVELMADKTRKMTIPFEIHVSGSPCVRSLLHTLPEDEATAVTGMIFAMMIGYRIGKAEGTLAKMGQN